MDKIEKPTEVTWCHLVGGDTSIDESEIFVPGSCQGMGSVGDEWDGICHIDGQPCDGAEGIIHWKPPRWQPPQQKISPCALPSQACGELVALLPIALEVFGSNDGLHPKMPRRGEAIQDALEAVAKAQLAHCQTTMVKIDWLFEPCPHSTDPLFLATRHECDECMEELSSQGQREEVKP